MRSPFTVLGAFLLVVAIARPAPAFAEDSEALIQKGIELRRKGQDEAAAREFQNAYALDPSPRAAAQLGLAEQALGRWLEAKAHLAEALRAKSDSWIKKNKTVLEQSLRTVSARIGHLNVTGTPAGAELFVNGKPAGRLPIAEPVGMAPGSARIELKADGHATSRMTVDVAPGPVTKVELNLERTTPLAAPTPAGSHEQGVNLVSASLSEPANNAATPGFWRGPGKWILMGASGVMLATGVGGMVAHNSKIGEFNTLGCVEDQNGRGVHKTNTANNPQCDSLLSGSKTRTKIAIAGFAGAGVLAATSALLFFRF